MDSLYDPSDHTSYPSRGQAPEIYATRLKENDASAIRTLIENTRQEILEEINTKEEASIDSPKNYTDVEIASLILDDLRKEDSLVYADGNFMKYGESHWETIDENNIFDKIYSYDKSKMESSKVSITDNKAKSILSILKNIARDKGDMFKNAPTGINCKNGFIKFDGEGNPTLTPHQKDNYCRYTLPGIWDKELPFIFETSFLKKFLEGIFKDDEDKKDKIRLLSEICGAAALGYGTKLDEPKAIILLGEKAGNGKSQFLDMIRGLLPKKAISCLCLGQMSDEKHIVNLAGIYLNASDELGTSTTIASDKFKTIIMGELTTGCAKYKNPITFLPMAQHVFATNGLPPFKGGMDKGVQRRLLVISFNSVIPYENRIVGIGKLIAEKEPDLLLNFAVQGASRLIKQKNFTVPSSSAEALKDWLLDADPVVEWLNDSSSVEVVEPSHRITTRQAYEYFKTWFTKSGLNQEYMVGIKTFVARIKANAPKGVLYKRMNDGRYFCGLHTKIFNDR
jgi:P4 family phage/plasmid primase-like protien